MHNAFLEFVLHWIAEVLDFFLLESAEGADVDSNSLAFIGKLTGYDSEEYQLSKYYITGATILFTCHFGKQDKQIGVDPLYLLCSVVAAGNPVP